MQMLYGEVTLSKGMRQERGGGMDVFRVRDRLIEDYREFTGSFVDIHDKTIREHVASAWPGLPVARPGCRSTRTSPPAGRSPSWSPKDCSSPECERIFRLKDNGPDGPVLRLHQHQREAIEAAHDGSSYVLTTGTGSGKSLAYIIPIVDRVLRPRRPGRYRPGIKAIVVYPMNALANSQLGELEKFLKSASRGPPVTFARYTGQESPTGARPGSSRTRPTSC